MYLSDTYAGASVCVFTFTIAVCLFSVCVLCVLCACMYGSILICVCVTVCMCVCVCCVCVCVCVFVCPNMLECLHLCIILSRSCFSRELYYSSEAPCIYSKYFACVAHVCVHIQAHTLPPYRSGGRSCRVCEGPDNRQNSAGSIYCRAAETRRQTAETQRRSEAYNTHTYQR